MPRPQWLITCWSFDDRRLLLIAVSILLVVDGLIALIFIGAVATQFSVVLMDWANRRFLGAPDA